MSSTLVPRRDPEDRAPKKLTTDVRDLPPAIQWHEGMLLAPQHFQSLDQRHEKLIHYHLAASSPYHWGILGFTHNSAMLSKGVFRVEELEAVMPDGLVVTHSAASDAALEIDLTDRLDEMKQRPVTVRLAVARRGRGVRLDERYATSSTTDIVDESTGEGEQTEVLRPKLQLRCDDPPGKYVHFPLAKIVFDKQFKAAPYEPPQLRMTPKLREIVDQLATTLRDKATRLARGVDAPPQAVSESQILDTKLMIHCLVGELPVLEALLRSGAAHPFVVYLALCSLAGHVAGVGKALVPPPFEAYDHNELLATFTAAQTTILRAIDEGIQESYSEYRFVPGQEEFRISFQPEWAGRPLYIGVRAPSGVSEQQMRDWVSSSVIGASSQLTDMRDRRVTGVNREAVDAASGLVPGRGVSLFAIKKEREDDLPDDGEDLVILSPRDEKRSRPEEIVLYVKNAPAAENPNVPRR